jgi:hypothetical protein
MMKKYAVLFLASLAWPAVLSAREGFGFTKKAAEMNVTSPPAINVSGTRASVKVRSDRSRVGSNAGDMERSIIDLINRAGTALRVASPADIRIDVDLDRLDVDHRTGSKTEYRSERRCCDKKGKEYYRSVPHTVYYTTVDARLDGRYKITDARGKVLDDGDLAESSLHDYEENAPSTSESEATLVGWAARRVASRVVPMQSRVTVLVPKGSFENFIPLAESNAWDRYLAAVEAVAPMRDPGSEAYRQYALAVAKEGLAYATADVSRARQLIREAAEHYRTAIRSNPEEKLFSEEHNSIFSSAGAPLPRAESSVHAYEAWIPAGTTPASKKPSPAPAKVARGKRLRNQSVIDMRKAGLSDANIKVAIDAADSVSFDTSPEALIALSKAGVSNDVILYMQKKR